MDMRARGILHAGIFGSVARGNDVETSDVDVISRDALQSIKHDRVLVDMVAAF
jgi:predicted nucleotidyltransferase